MLTGTAAMFQHIHFTTEGTAPLGREHEDWDEESVESWDGESKFFGPSDVVGKVVGDM